MISLVIQAGGKSSRMGRDKGILPLQGKPLITHVLDRIKDLADEVFITTNHPANYQFLQLRMVPDRYPDKGALGGLYTALEAATQPIVMVVACDMPFVNKELLAYMKNTILEENADAVIPCSSHGLEPLHAIYRKGTCLPAIKHALDNGQMRLISWHHDVSKIITIPFEKVKSFDADEIAFFNVNTPEQLKIAETILKTLNT